MVLCIEYLDYVGEARPRPGVHSLSVTRCSLHTISCLLSHMPNIVNPNMGRVAAVSFCDDLGECLRGLQSEVKRKTCLFFLLRLLPCGTYLYVQFIATYMYYIYRVLERLFGSRVGVGARVAICRAAVRGNSRRCSNMPIEVGFLGSDSCALLLLHPHPSPLPPSLPLTPSLIPTSLFPNKTNKCRPTRNSLSCSATLSARCCSSCWDEGTRR